MREINVSESVTQYQQQSTTTLGRNYYTRPPGQIESLRKVAGSGGFSPVTQIWEFAQN